MSNIGKKHAKRVSNRCFGTLVGLANTKHVILPEVLPRLIDTLVMLQIRYCVQVYGSVGPRVLGKIQKVFNFAARIVSWQRKYDHISDIMEKT